MSLTPELERELAPLRSSTSDRVTLAALSPSCSVCTRVAAEFKAFAEAACDDSPCFAVPVGTSLIGVRQYTEKHGLTSFQPRRVEALKALGVNSTPTILVIDWKAREITRMIGPPSLHSNRLKNTLGIKLPSAPMLWLRKIIHRTTAG